MFIKIKYGRYTNRRIRAHESDSEVTVRRLGKIIQKIFFCSIRSQHSQSRLEMVWRDSFPRGSFTFIENFRSYDFCPVYFVSPRLTAPGSPRMDAAPSMSRDDAKNHNKELLEVRRVS